MRKSQAPSYRAKLDSNTREKNLNFNISCSSEPEKPFKSVRSTESILNLILNSDKSEPDVEQVVGVKCLQESNELKNKEETDSCSKFDMPATVYNVVYGKQSRKKHKIWEGDGILEIGSKYLTLKNEEGKIIGTVPCPKARRLEEGNRIFVGNKEVELVNIVEKEVSKTQLNLQNKNDQLILEKKTVSRPKLKILGRKFKHPMLDCSSAIMMPYPSAEHQWTFNEKGLTLTPVKLEGSLASKLREHQITGVTFLFECIMGYREINETGVILADEMGLGKTLQCIALIWTLLKQGPYGNEPVVKKVLIVTPSSLTMNWYNEFNKWLGQIKLVPFVVSQKNKPSDLKGPVMIISYEMLIRYFEDVEKHNFDLLICDEGHRLKNTSIRTTQILNSLNCSKRILLTGTPIQNDLQEFFAIVDFVNPNSLGSFAEFRRRYEEPILASRQPNVSEDIVAKGRECSQDLKRITSKFLLRRTRDILSKVLPPRQEIVVFCKITDFQEKLYNSLIDSFVGAKEKLLGFSDGFAHLEVIMILRKICNHPDLLNKENLGQSFSNFHYENKDVPDIDVSVKVSVTINFLKELQETSSREKVVVVSNSTKTLDMLEKIMNSVGFITCRLDGRTPVAQRNEIVERFNKSYSKAFVFLLSAKAGGVGLNLVGASRLILFDSDWNPATDLQAIGRIWRDGQKYPVFIYRLLTTGTIEEKIYQRQISKQGLSESTVDSESTNSIKFSEEELKDIFSPCFIKEDCLTHNVLLCNCSKRGEIPAPEVEPEEKNFQLLKASSPSLKMSELFHWEHHGLPFDSNLLSQLCLKTSEKLISFIFRSCKS